MEKQKYKTVASIQRSLAERLDAEIFELKKRQADIQKLQADVLVIEARIALIEDLLGVDTRAIANGKDGGCDDRS